MEPTILQAISAGIFVGIIIVLIAIVSAYFAAEWYRTKRGSTRYEYAYHTGRNNYEVKYITGGRNV